MESSLAARSYLMTLISEKKRPRGPVTYPRKHVDSLLLAVSISFLGIFSLQTPCWRLGELLELTREAAGTHNSPWCWLSVLGLVVFARVPLSRHTRGQHRGHGDKDRDRLSRWNCHLYTVAYPTMFSHRGNNCAAMQTWQFRTTFC